MKGKNFKKKRKKKEIRTERKEAFQRYRTLTKACRFPAQSNRVVEVFDQSHKSNEIVMICKLTAP